jgi:hypothetical protein
MSAFIEHEKWRLTIRLLSKERVPNRFNSRALELTQAFPSTHRFQSLIEALLWAFLFAAGLHGSGRQ